MQKNWLGSFPDFVQQLLSMWRIIDPEVLTSTTKLSSTCVGPVLSAQADLASFSCRPLPSFLSLAAQSREDLGMRLKLSSTSVGPLLTVQLAYWPTFWLCVHWPCFKSGRPAHNLFEQFMNQSKIRNPIVTYTLTLMIWSGVSQMMVVGVVCSRHGNTLDASRGRLFPSHNCKDAW